MATKIGSLFGDVTLRTADLDKSIKSVGKKMKRMGKQFQDVGKSLSLKLTAPIAAFGVMSVKAFAEQEKAEEQLRAALQASGQEVENNLRQLRRMASEIQQVTTVGDELSLSLVQQATSMGLQADRAGEAVKGAIGLSKAFDLDLKMAIRASTSALQGQTEILTRYIPELKNIEDPAERVALVQRKMAEGFDVATAEARTTHGQMVQLKNAFGDLQEQIGAILAEHLTPLVDKLRGLVKQLQNVDEETLRLGVQIAALVATVGPLLLILGKLLAIFSSVKAVVLSLGIALGVVLNKMGLLREVGEALGQLLIDIWEGDIIASIGSFIAILAEVVELFTGPLGLSFAADKVRSDVVAAFRAMRAPIDAVIGMLRDALGLFQALGNFVTFGEAGRIGERAGDVLSKTVFRASGGPLSAGQPAIVGEEGPELFVPGRAGDVVPSGAFGGGNGGTNITMNFAPGVGMDIVTQLKNNRNLLADFAIEAVQENNLRSV